MQAAFKEKSSYAGDILSLREVTKTYGDTLILKGVSLSIRRGEFVSLLGPSGCGKTTTLRIIAGFMQCTSGDIVLNQERVNDIPCHRRGTAMVFQNYALFPHMNVFDNVAFGPRMHKVRKEEARRKVEKALDLVQLPHLASRFPKELSGGQQQRVALARAVALEPTLLLLDEPLSNLDSKLRKELRNEFREVHRLSGATTIFVTHDIEEAFALSDRVAVMNGGRVEQFDTPYEIYSNPQSRFVADFVGHANVITGLLAHSDRGASIAFGGSSILVPPATHSKGSASYAVPTPRVRISRKPLPLENTIPARVVSVAYLGATVEYRVSAGGQIFNGETFVDNDLISLHSNDEVFIGWGSEDMIELADKGAQQ